VAIKKTSKKKSTKKKVVKTIEPPNPETPKTDPTVLSRIAYLETILDRKELSLEELKKVLPVERTGPRNVLVISSPRTGDFYIPTKNENFKVEMALLGIDVVFLEYTGLEGAEPKMQMFYLDEKKTIKEGGLI